MTDIIEELAHRLYLIEYCGEGSWSKANVKLKIVFRDRAKEILTFLEPYITEKQKEAWDAALLSHVQASHPRREPTSEVRVRISFKEWQAEQKGKV